MSQAHQQPDRPGDEDDPNQLSAVRLARPVPPRPSRRWAEPPEPGGDRPDEGYPGAARERAERSSPTVEPFGARLRRALDTRGPLCVGIDPHASLLRDWGLPDTARGLATFCETVVAAVADRVAVVKPQSAFFERFGAAGIEVLESTIRQSRAAGALVILDVKRGDIGSTAVAYADAYLDPLAPLYADAVTVSPYLGFGSLAPFLDAAAAHGGGVFVLALTSNPAGRQVQHARTESGKTVAQSLLDDIAVRNAGALPLGSIGVVVGATVRPSGHDLSALNGPILTPGLGAQGGTPADLGDLFRGVERAVVPSYSREILDRGPRPADLRAATETALAACQKALNYVHS